MSWSYSPGFISLTGTTASLHKIRFAVGDTDSTRQQLQDEEIFGILTWETSPMLAAAACCDGLAAKYSFQMNVIDASLQVMAERRMAHYQNLADRLRRGGAGDIPGDENITLIDGIYVGGASIAGKQSFASDDDFVQPSFSLGQDDNPFVQTGATSGF